MENALDFSGKVVIVTGGGKGVGKGITETFLAAGADVLICGRSEPESLPQCNGRKALFFNCDVRDFEQIEACVDFAMQQYGRVDVLVNNAGGAPFAEVSKAAEKKGHKVWPIVYGRAQLLLGHAGALKAAETLYGAARRGVRTRQTGRQ